MAVSARYKETIIRKIRREGAIAADAVFHGIAYNILQYNDRVSQGNEMFTNLEAHQLAAEIIRQELEDHGA